MLKNIFLVFVFLLSVLNTGESITCYHCYDVSNRTLSFGNVFDEAEFGDKLVKCDKNMNHWNTWVCPTAWPECVIITAKVDNHYELVRSCEEKNFCSKYKPPANVTVESCRECNTTLCNDFVKVPDPPVNPGPLFVFNVHVNLKVDKHPLLKDDKNND